MVFDLENWGFSGSLHRPPEDSPAATKSDFQLNRGEISSPCPAAAQPLFLANSPGVVRHRTASRRPFGFNSPHAALACARGAFQ
jgi:hypothetical protein